MEYSMSVLRDAFLLFLILWSSCFTYQLIGGIIWLLEMEGIAYVPNNRRNEEFKVALYINGFSDYFNWFGYFLVFFFS